MDLNKPKLETGTVLVVDDSPDSRSLMRRYLELDGHTVEEAVDGLDALQKMSYLRADVILMDVDMPKMDGARALRQIKDNDALRTVPVIMMSAHESREIALECIQFGADDYLDKPVSRSVLEARLQNCLRRKRMIDRLDRKLVSANRDHARAREVLQAILPPRIVEEVLSIGHVPPRSHDEVAVMFCDVVGFTSFCNRNDAETVVANLQQLTALFDSVAQRHGVEKIKSMGDAFLGAANLLQPAPDPVLNCVRCSIDMLRESAGLRHPWHLRIGIALGPLVSGILGDRKFLFDIWGDTVNLAQRIESSANQDSICVSELAWLSLNGNCRGRSRGSVSLKGVGEVQVFQIDGLV